MNKITKDELIVRQQMEIEDLKAEVKQLKDLCREASNHLYMPEQWSAECPDFPKVARTAIVRANQCLREAQ